MESFYSQGTEETGLSGSGMVEGNYSLTSTCAASTLQAAVNGTVLPAPVAISARVFQILYGSLQVALGILLNVLILILVFSFKKLRIPSSGIAVQIAIANLTLTITNGIPTIVNNIAGRWILGVDLCILSGFAIFTLTIFRTLLILVFSFDRFASVFAPFFYPKHSRRITILMCTLAWSISIITSLLGIPPILDCYIFSEPTLFCVVSPRCSKKCMNFFYTCMSTIIIPAILTPIGLFLSLYIKGRKIRRKESKILGLTKRIITDQEWRAMKTFFLLFLALVLVTFLPLLLFNIASLLGSVARILVVKLANNIVTLLVITDPIIIMRNTDIKEAFNILMKPFINLCSTTLQKREQIVESYSSDQGQKMEFNVLE